MRLSMRVFLANHTLSASQSDFVARCAPSTRESCDSARRSEEVFRSVLGVRNLSAAARVAAWARDLRGSCRAFALRAAVFFLAGYGAATGCVRAFLCIGHESSNDRLFKFAAAIPPHLTLDAYWGTRGSSLGDRRKDFRPTLYDELRGSPALLT